MSLLNSPRCPNCNSEINLKELWRFAPKSGRGSGLAGKVGVVCPVCGIKLRVLDGHMRLLSVGLFALMVCGAAIVGLTSRSFGNDRPILVGFVALYAVGFIVFQKSIPRLLRLRVFEEGEKASFPLVSLAEDLAAQRESIAEDPAIESETESAPAWNCPKCHAENPGNFDECWKCQTWRAEESNAK